jgi:Alr-MurF fusion protein
MGRVFSDMLFSQLKHITQGTILQLATDRRVDELVIDSRKAISGVGSLFFAVRGLHHNGHHYISQLYHDGIRQFVVEENSEVEKFPEANFIQVKSSIDALQKIAAFHRDTFMIPIIGITGSNGKTIVKEWLYQLLVQQYTIVKNPGSYNSQVGVPLSVWQIQSYHTLGIFEAGISQPGEMEKLEQVIKPTIGVFTTLGTAHDENFQSAEQKITEKIKLFRGVEALICSADQTNAIGRLKAANLPLITWGLSAAADVQIVKADNRFNITWKDKKFSISLPFSDPASVENAFHCMTILLYLGTDFGQIQQRLDSLRAVPMRLELKEGINQNQLIDDAYNNDLGGLKISLDLLSNQNQKKKKTLILSDILQSGMEENQLTDRIAQLVNASAVNKVVGIGKILSSHKGKIKPTATFYTSIDDFLNVLDPDSFHNEMILIKGARAFGFERIVSRLQRKVHGTVMEVDLNALIHNLNFFKTKLAPATKLMVMVKALAYGSGSVEIANLLQYHRVDYLGVAYADEGVDLRKNNIKTPVMVMNPTEEGFQAMIHFNLEPELYGFSILKSFISFLNGRTWNVHIKIDTGMHRLGFDVEELSELITVLKANPNLKVSSIFTHLSGSDEASLDEFSHHQVREFKAAAARLSEALRYNPALHVLNTPGILRFPEYQFDMVRLGVGLYGVDPTAERHNLKPVNTLKTLISQIRTVKAGETVGYGRKGKAINDMRIGTIAIGYADGYSRAFSKGVGEVLVNGKRAPVIGNVCMDMTMIDLTGIDAHEGSEVIVFGNGLSVDELATRIHTIPYEILTNTSERVKRVFVTESI